MCIEVIVCNVIVVFLRHTVYIFVCERLVSYASDLVVIGNSV